MICQVESEMKHCFHLRQYWLNCVMLVGIFTFGGAFEGQSMT